MAVQELTTELGKMVLTMVLGLAAARDEVRIGEAWLAPEHLVLTVEVASGDLGRVIGKQGRTARSMRTILGAAAHSQGVRCEVNIAVGTREERAGE